MDLDKAKGIIYGMAIGDALGRPTEFLPLSQINSEYLNDLATRLAEKKESV
ncbi:MAG: ADP-ribosylglycohydrolase family protein [Pseudomonadota bacterium]